MGKMIVETNLTKKTVVGQPFLYSCADPEGVTGAGHPENLQKYKIF